MKLELVIHNQVVICWNIPDKELMIDGAENWDWESRCKYRISVVDRWVKSMQRAYAEKLQFHAPNAHIQITISSRANEMIDMESDFKTEKFPVDEHTNDF